jgi:glycosyltransferase involved in cell wall biosynthesis
MISVIICSADKDLLKQVSENIAATIGVPYEIIAFDNSTAKLGICAVYNKGILQAQYDTLCFMHEDILMKTDNWGQIIISLFNNDHQLGLVGVAGSTYKPLSPSGWRGFDTDSTYLNIIQSSRHTPTQSRLDYLNPTNQSLARVAAVDGVWLCTTKSIAKEFMFDETTFKEFHAYDVDFSLSIGTKYKVAVTFEVLLDHFSGGNYNKTWIQETLKLHFKWQQHLPVNIDHLVSPKQSAHTEKKTFRDFTDQLVKLNYPINNLFTLLWKNNRFLKLNVLLFCKLNLYLVQKLLKSKKQVH